MADAKWAAARIGLQLLIDDIPFEVVQAAMSFERNVIPSCTVTVAVGRNVVTGQAANVHTKLGLIRIRSSFKLTLIMTPLGGQGGVPNKWEDETLIFDGHVTGSGWQRSTGGAQFTIHAEHWLADLNYSSSLSGASHPGNPADYTYSAGHVPMDVEVAGGRPLQWLPGNLVDHITRADMEIDLWENVLKKWMVAVSNAEPIDDRIGAGADAEDEAAGALPKNDAALAALAKIKSEAMAMDLSSGAADEVAIGDAVGLALNHAMTLNDVHTTLWGKLVGEWSPQYFFTVIPRVTDALIVPFAGAFRGVTVDGQAGLQEWADIAAGDYVQCDLNCSLPQLLRCVAIIYPVEYTGGGNLSPAEHQEKRRGVAGLYPTNLTANRKGMSMLKDAPLWMANSMMGLAYAPTCTGANPRAAIQHGQAPMGEGPAQDPANSPKDNQREFKRIMDDYAHQWYVHEMLKGRVGELSGRLRFDIAPGSQVRVEAGIDPHVRATLEAPAGSGAAAAGVSPEDFAELGPVIQALFNDKAAAAKGNEDLLGEEFFACVEKVTHVINSEAQQAGTSFTLAHIRTSAENNDDETSVDKPPLYKEGWLGKSLIDSYKSNQ